VTAGNGVHNVVIENGLIFDASQVDESYLSKTPASGHTTKWTFSCWVKRGKLGTLQKIFGANSGSDYVTLRFNSDDELHFYSYVSATYDFQYTTDTKFRDPSAWIHIHVIYDTGQAVDSDRITISVNGTQITDFSVETKATLNYASIVNTATLHNIGRSAAGLQYYDGYMAEIAFCGGRTYSVDYFGEFHPDSPSIWRPISVAGLDYSGVNSFHLDFADNSSVAALGYDVSGNDFHWNVNNITTAEQVSDSPTNNSCTASNVDIPDLGDIPTFTYGNRNIKSNGASNYHAANGTFNISSGKWYYEAKVTYIEYQSASKFGVIHVSDTQLDASTGEQWFFSHDNANTDVYKTYQGSDTTITGFGHLVLNDIMQVAFDMDSGKIWFGVNNVWIEGNPSAGTGESFSSLYGTVVPRLLQVGLNECRCNFSEDTFVYTPPTGFNALMAKYLPAPTIKDPRDYFDPIGYTGDGNTARVIPTQNKVDHLIVKCRTVSYSWRVVDSVRGVPAMMKWDVNSMESSPPDEISALGAVSGFTIEDALEVNSSGQTFIALPFTKSPIAGMDITLYTGSGINRTLAHSLGVEPELMIVKKRTDDVETWAVYHKYNGTPNECLFLDTNAQSAYNASYWNATDPTSTNFHLGIAQATNGSGDTYVNYLFASVPGFSRVFAYIGNSSTNGPFIHCGFKPAFIMIKRTNSAGDWTLHTIPPNDVEPAVLHAIPSLGTVEATATRYIDMLENGFKIRHTNELHNINGSGYVGIAFAQHPFAMLNNSEL
jgi:hypothetical protein